MRWLVLTAVLALSGCKSGDSLAVIAVDAPMQVDNIAVLHAIAMIGGVTMEHDLGASAAPFSIPPAKTFGIQVQSSLSGLFAVRVEARDASGKVLGDGQGSGTITPGQRTDIPITLGKPVPVVASRAVWIGSGGSGIGAATASQLNVGLGGSDSISASIAASNASFSSGFFSSQLED